MSGRRVTRLDGRVVIVLDRAKAPAVTARLLDEGATVVVAGSDLAAAVPATVPPDCPGRLATFSDDLVGDETTAALIEFVVEQFL